MTLALKFRLIHTKSTKIKLPLFQRKLSEALFHLSQKLHLNKSLREEKVRRWHYPQENGISVIVKCIQRNIGNRGRIWETLNGDEFKENFQRGVLFDS